MAFGFEGHEQKHWSEQNLEIAISKLQDTSPSFGPEGNTRQTGEKYFVMGLEVYRPEYEKFMDKLQQVMDQVLENTKHELDRAA